MHSWPKVPRSFVDRMLIDIVSPAYLLVDDRGILVERGGELGNYGLAGLRKGDSVLEKVDYLHGIIPRGSEAPSIRLSCLKVGNSCPADIHIFGAEGGTWLIYLDSALRETELLVSRQRANDANLSGERFERSLVERLGPALEAYLAERPRRGAERLERLGFLAFELRSPSPAGGSGELEAAFAALDSSLASLGREAARLGGFVEGHCGRGLLAIFGLPSSRPASEDQRRGDPARDAFEAALRNAAALSPGREGARGGLPRPFGYAMGLAAGPALVGNIGDRAARSFAVLAEAREPALGLAEAAGEGELLIDADCRALLPESLEGFKARSLELPGFSGLRDCFALGLEGR